MAKILIVDDDRHIIQQLTAWITSFEHRAASTMYPTFLVQTLDAEAVDLILMDIYMPEIDGVSLLKQLKQHPKYHSIPVIMLTSDTDEQRLAECLEVGAVDFLNKPISPVVLRARIRSALSVQNYIHTLQSVNRHLKSIFDGMAEGVVTLDSHFRVQMISSKACQMLGVEESEMSGKPAAAVLGSPLAGPSGVLMDYVNHPKDPGEFYTQLLCPNGAMIPIRLTITRLESEISAAQWLLAFQNRREEERMLRENSHGTAFGKIVSGDIHMHEIFQLIETVAASNSTVLIQGESGTGKELVAQEVHERSRRAQKPFYAINCAAIPSHLLESEFFGHERGAFTGAQTSKPGHFELANGGTLFLDEVGDIPPELQVKLLRALQDQTFRRVGGTKMVRVNVRIISATNRNLQKLVEAEVFREDLYYRLDVVSIKLPPLRERIQDIPLLVTAFVEEINRKEHRNVSGVAPDFLKPLLNYTWPGNVRELYNVIEHAFAVSQTTLLQRDHLPTKFKQMTTPPPKEETPPMSEKEAILRALEQTGYHRGKAAAVLGISQATLYRKLKKYNIGS